MNGALCALGVDVPALLVHTRNMKTALPVLEHRQSQSHNLIDRVKEKIKS